ncbi:MAG: phosphatase PAP2 family protein [Jatrophihabitantaceae bacterium]
MSDDTIAAVRSDATIRRAQPPPARAWTVLRPSRVEVLRVVRWGATALWALLFVRQCYADGLPFDRDRLLLWITPGVAVASIGRRALWTVVADWLPFALVLVAYDYLRGVSDTLGMPTWWTPQITVDKWLFLGTEPTVWLQEHLKFAGARWWDIPVCLCYISFFFLPYFAAGVLWLRSRSDFRRWAARFVTLSFLGFVFFALVPTAPPWAAARCTAAQVATHPNNPPCLYADPAFVPHGGLLGAAAHPRPGAMPYIERISGRGWSALHLSAARSLLNAGQDIVDQVAAVPSLHAGGTMLFAIFMWRRVRKLTKIVLAAYVTFMGFTLVYTGEHYLLDILAGWLAAAAVCVLFDRVERRRTGRQAADTLGAPSPESPEPTASRMENLCPPTATTPSST